MSLTTKLTNEIHWNWISYVSKVANIFKRSILKYHFSNEPAPPPFSILLYWTWSWIKRVIIQNAECSAGWRNTPKKVSEVLAGRQVVFELSLTCVGALMPYGVSYSWKYGPFRGSIWKIFPFTRILKRKNIITTLFS